MNKDEIIVMMIALMFVAVVWGSAISYDMGYKKGIQYQEEQPVNITVSWYNATCNTASFDEYILTDKEEISISPEQGISVYNIQKSHVGDP